MSEMVHKPPVLRNKHNCKKNEWEYYKIMQSNQKPCKSHEAGNTGQTVYLINVSDF
jgi:hypothetical protein